MKSLLADITPLRRHRTFRRLWAGLLISSIGSQLTIVAVAYQAYVLTHSTLIVGLVSLVQLVRRWWAPWVGEPSLTPSIVVGS